MSSRPGTAPGPDSSSRADANFTRRNLVSSSSSNTSHKAPVFALAWSANGKKLASASTDGVVKVWSVAPPDAPAGDKPKSDRADHEFVHSNKEVVTSLCFNPRRDDQLLVVGGHVTKVWNLGAKGSVSLLCEVDVPEAISATWHPHDRILVAQLHNKLSDIDLRKAGGDKDKKRQARKLVTRANGDEVTGVTFIDKGSRVLVATQHGVEVRAWPSFELLTVLDGHAKHGGRDGGVTAMAVTREEDMRGAEPSADGREAGKVLRTRLLATGGNDTLICIWDLQYGVPQSVIYRPDEAVRALSFSADQSLLAYCQEDVPGQSCNVEIMDVKTGRHVASVPLQRGTEVCAFNPRYKQLLALAEPCVVMSSYRDSKSKDTLACLVSLVQLK